MKLTLFGGILLGIVFLFLFSEDSKLSSISNENLYILHTKNGNIKCNYHNSRDLNNDYMLYYDAKTKEQTFIKGWEIDSITILSENVWSCGPKNDKLKYIKLNL
jgi:hypothetical protein